MNGQERFEPTGDAAAEARRKWAPTFAGARAGSEGVEQIELHALEVGLLFPRGNSGRKNCMLQAAVPSAADPQGVTGHSIRSHLPECRNPVLQKVRRRPVFAFEEG